MVEDEEKAPQSCRPSLKVAASFNNYANWKHKLRENCLKRVREDRNRLLWGSRLPEAEAKGQSSKHKLIKVNAKRFCYRCKECFMRILRERKAEKPENVFSITKWEDEDDEYLARMVYNHMLLDSDQVREEVWCPICTTGKLQENAHYIYCSQCKLKLGRGLEVDLNFLRLRLAETHMEHLDRGCRLKPMFCLETKFELAALYIKCEGCRTFDIVL